MTYAIEAEGLVKRYGTVTALSSVDLAAKSGQVLGVLGPNGAGKSTVIRILATLLRPDAGIARVHGLDVVKDAPAVRRLIGLTGQFTSVDLDLTAAENLRMIGRLLDLSRSESRARTIELLADFELSDVADRPLSTFSGGMRRRLDLAAGLVGRPAVAYLDEPTTGLDPGKRGALWKTIRSLADRGCTVLLTTQYLEEADALCDEISVIDHGRHIAHGSPAELKLVVGRQAISVRPTDPTDLPQAAEILQRISGRSPDISSGGVVTVPATESSSFENTVRGLAEAGIDVSEHSLRLPSLEEAFFALTDSHAPGLQLQEDS